MRKLNLVMIIGFIFILCACTDKNDDVFVKNQKNINVKHEKVPLIPLEEKPAQRTKAYTPSVCDNLGMGYNPSKYPFAASKNTLFRVINVDKIINDDKISSTIRIKNINESFAKFRSFSTFKEYKNELVKKFKKTYEANANFFGIVKSSFKKEFSFMSKDIDKESVKNIFGEAEIGIKTKSFSINLLNENQIYNYLDYNFKHDYFSVHPKRLFETYGRYVLTDYDAGGRAFGVYRGTTKEKHSKKYKEKKFSTTVKASFGGILKKIISGGGSHYKEEKDSVVKEARKKFSRFEMAIKTFGGNPGLGIPTFIGPAVPENLNIDLKEWGASVTNPNFYEISDINDKGLTPIEFFVKEDNIKKMLLKYIETNDTITESTDLSKLPKFKLRKPVFYIDAGGYGSDLYIMTRFGDLLRISDGKFRRVKEANGAPIQNYVEPLTTDGFPIECKAVENGEYGGFSGLQFNVGMDVYYCPVHAPVNEFGDYLFNGIENPYAKLKYDLSGFNKDDLCIYKLKDDPSGIRYLRVKTKTHTYALAILNNDIATNLYGLLLKNIPVHEVHNDYLANMTIIAL